MNVGCVTSARAATPSRDDGVGERKKGVDLRAFLETELNKNKQPEQEKSLVISRDSSLRYQGGQMSPPLVPQMENRSLRLSSGPSCTNAGMESAVNVLVRRCSEVQPRRLDASKCLILALKSSLSNCCKTPKIPAGLNMFALNTGDVKVVFFMQWTNTAGVSFTCCAEVKQDSLRVHSELAALTEV